MDIPTLPEDLFERTDTVVDKFVDQVIFLGPFRSLRLKISVHQEAYGSSVNISWIPAGCQDRLNVLRAACFKVTDDLSLEALAHSLLTEYKWCQHYRC